MRHFGTREAGGGGRDVARALYGHGRGGSDGGGVTFCCWVRADGVVLDVRTE